METRLLKPSGKKQPSAPGRRSGESICGSRALGLAAAVVVLAYFSPALAADPRAPNYSPQLLINAEGGAPGQLVTDYAKATAPEKKVYSSTMQGPFGSGISIQEKQTEAGQHFFGGALKDGINAGEGKDVWLRVYHFFPQGYCYGYSNQTPPANYADGNGKMKWFRLQYSNNERFTVELGGFANVGAKGQSCPSSSTVWGAIEEFSHASGGLRALPNSDAKPIPRGQWAAVQVHIHLSSSAGSGYLEAWVDDTYLGRKASETLPPNAQLQSVWYGNYWNGGAPSQQHWFIDEIIMTTAAPDTTDSGGRRYIHPQTRVADFKGGGGDTAPDESPPRPPTDVRTSTN